MRATTDTPKEHIALTDVLAVLPTQKGARLESRDCPRGHQELSVFTFRVKQHYLRRVRSVVFHFGDGNECQQWCERLQGALRGRTLRGYLVVLLLFFFFFLFFLLSQQGANHLVGWFGVSCASQPVEPELINLAQRCSGVSLLSNLQPHTDRARKSTAAGASLWRFFLLKY